MKNFGFAHETQRLALAWAVAHSDELEIRSFTTLEMADGSGRICTLIEYGDDDKDRTARVTSPPPSRAPAWTRGLPQVFTTEETC